jgi:D-threonine aldolase
MSPTAHSLPTPLLVLDAEQLDRNIDAMAAVRPGPALRPHVKAFKSTELARHVARRGGHDSFCCATLREMEGMVAAGLDHDLLLANETLDTDRLARIVEQSDGRITVAVDSTETITAAAGTGASVLIDVDVGMPRCGCAPAEAGRLADLARAAGLEVRGVMGYEGHVVGEPDRGRRVAAVHDSMQLLRRALEDVGGGIASAGGTGTFDLHDWADEVQAGSYLLMDTHYARLGLPFLQALTVETTVISSSPDRGWAVLDAGLKAFGMDHGNPSADRWEIFYCSDEHTTVLPDQNGSLPGVGDRVALTPAHIDPTVACHESIHVVSDGEVVDRWPVDLRGW